MRDARMATRSSLSTVKRPKLSDVTNLPAPTRNEKLPEISTGDKDLIEQLMRERLALIKLFTERNKIIDLSGAELQKLRVSVQKLQLQNWNLARSNSQMLAELNSGKDRAKALQHELLCKEALLKTKNFEMQGKSEMKCQSAGCKVKEAECATLYEADNDEKPCIGNKRRATRSQSLGASNKFQKVEQSLGLQGKEETKCQNTSHQLEEGEEPALQEATKDEKPGAGNKMHVTRSRSMGASTTCQNIEQKDKVEIKRQSLRRRSSRFKFHEEEQTENLFEVEEAKIPENQMNEDEQTENLFKIEEAKLPENPMNEDDPIPFFSSAKQEKEDRCTEKSEGVSQRSSVGRPVSQRSAKQEKEDRCTEKSEGVSQRSSVGRPVHKAVKKDISFPEDSVPNGGTKKKKEESGTPKSEGVSQRSSIARPVRRAVEKVQSYKELPLRTKMRRTE